VRTALTFVVLASLGCTGVLAGDRDAPELDVPGLDAPRADVPGLDAPVPDVPGLDAPGIDSGPEPMIDAGPCGGTLAGSLSLVDLAVGSGAQAAPTPSGGVLVAWRGAGDIQIQRFDGGGAAFGPALTTRGDGLWGVAASSDRNAVLVSRGDELVLVVFPAAGGSGAETRLMGAVDHMVTNNEWFGDLLRAGRLDWNGTQWIAYSTVQRLWPDGVAHYGDTLRRFAADGTAAGADWDWGCSHSMEVRLTHDAAGSVAPVCSSDCYPDKGVFFRHRTTVHLDPSGNCAGYVEQRLGGVAAISSGFLIGFTSRAGGRGSIDPGVAVASGSGIGTPTFLSADGADASDLHLAPYPGGAVAAWIEGGGRLARLDAAGAVVSSETIDVAAISGAGDFFAYADGDVGWVVGTRLARLRACP
jgi:hypothetical protein